MAQASSRMSHVFPAVLAAMIAACGGGDGGPGTPSPVIQKAASASGDGQTAQIGTALANPLRVVVTLSGVPKSGSTVTWAATGAGASVSPTTSITDALGIATTGWTLGTTVGAQSATATLAGATGSPVSFAAAATATPVPVIAKTATTSGDGQTGTVGNPLANPLRVLVTLSGAPLSGQTITWGTSGTGSAVTPPTSVTDATGIATTTWTINNTAGAQSATATLAGATGSPVTFAGTGIPRDAAFIAVASGNNQSGNPGGALANPLKVRVTDQFGNGVSGVSVDWAVTSGTASVGSLSSLTDATGVAQVGVTLGATPGPVTITATSGILTGSPVTFNATVTSFPVSAAVSVGDNFFRSVRNTSANPAVDTIAVNGTVTWTWTGLGTHSVESTGSPVFASSTIKTSGTYSFTFITAGTYTYDCAVHGLAMTGTIVVR
jgi:plastocyanin